MDSIFFHPNQVNHITCFYHWSRHKEFVQSCNHCMFRMYRSGGAMCVYLHAVFFPCFLTSILTSHATSSKRKIRSWRPAACRCHLRSGGGTAYFFDCVLFCWLRFWSLLWTGSLPTSCITSFSRIGGPDYCHCAVILSWLPHGLCSAKQFIFREGGREGTRSRQQAGGQRMRADTGS